jgi:hypothetical protein
VAVSSAIDEIQAYLAINDLKEPSGSVSAYRHTSPQAFKGGRKATAAKVHPLGFNGLELLFSPFFQPPVDRCVLETYSPCRFVAPHAFSYECFVPL